MNLGLSPETLSQLKLLQIKSRRSFLTNRHGGHTSLKRGHGIEFSDYGSYQLGDDIRHIDWNVFARSDRLYVKRYQEEEDLCVACILDASASMFTGNELSTSQKWDTARKLAIALSYITLMQKDRVFFSVPGSYQSQAIYDTRSLSFSARALEEQAPTNIESPLKAFAASIQGLRFPGLVFYFSDFLYPHAETEQMLNYVLAKNMDTIFVQVLSKEETDISYLPESALLTDSETGAVMNLHVDENPIKEYAKLFNAHQQGLRELCAKRQVAFVSVTQDTPLVDIIQQAFVSKGLLQ